MEKQRSCSVVNSGRAHLARLFPHAALQRSGSARGAAPRWGWGGRRSDTQHSNCVCRRTVEQGPDTDVVWHDSVSQRESHGLGNAQSVDFVVSGTALVNARCYTRKGNTPQAANKQDQNEVLSEFS